MITIKKGLDLPIAGKPEQTIYKGNGITEVAVLGEDYIGMRPSMKVREGDVVKKGQILFEDKKNAGVVFTAPASGKIVAINRGEKRILQSVVIELQEGEQESFAKYKRAELSNLSEAQVRENLQKSGLWTAFRTRPFSKIPAVDAVPYAIFVNTMDTNPLCADPAVIINANAEDFINGLIVLSGIQTRKLYVCKASGSQIPLPPNSEKIFQVKEFQGVHPAGLVGTHIHFLEGASLNKVVWHLNYQDVIAIGKLFITGELHNERIVALGGSQVKKPRLVSTILGANLTQLTMGELENGENRIISGSVLYGRKAEGAHNYLGRYALQVSVIEEDRQKRFLGWIAPSRNDYSISRTVMGHFLHKLFKMKTAVYGGHRAMVPIGLFEKVMPLDILPTMLLRDLAVMDTESAQSLGCLELDEEDLALCTYVCPGKTDYATLLRQTLTQIEKDG